MNGRYPHKAVRFLALVFSLGGIAYFGLSSQAHNAELRNAAVGGSSAIVNNPPPGGEPTLNWNEFILAGAGASLGAPRESAEDSASLPSADIYVAEEKKKILTLLPTPQIILEEKQEEPQNSQEALSLLSLPRDTSPRPDLAALAFSYYGSALIPGNLLGFSTVIKNTGEEKTKSSSNAQLFLDKGNDGTFETVFKKLEVRVLEPDETETVTWGRAWYQSPGTYGAKVCADIDNAVKEGDEGNNCASTVFTVAGLVASGDLVVENAATIPPHPLANQSVSFSAVLRNTDISKVSGFFVRLTLDGVLTAKTRVTSLSGGESTNLEWKTIWMALPGDHRYEICADSGNDIYETNENNNCSSGLISVPNE